MIDLSFLNDKEMHEIVLISDMANVEFLRVWRDHKTKKFENHWCRLDFTNEPVIHTFLGEHFLYGSFFFTGTVSAATCVPVYVSQSA